MTKRPFVPLVLLGCSLLVSACALRSQGDAQFGRVFDTDQGRPIADALVVQGVSARRPKLHGSDDKGFVFIAETRTDAEGRFSFPAWGPTVHEYPVTSLDLYSFARGRAYGDSSRLFYWSPPSRIESYGEIRLFMTQPNETLGFAGSITSRGNLTQADLRKREAGILEYVLASVIATEDDPCVQLRVLPMTIAYLREARLVIKGSPPYNRDPIEVADACPKAEASAGKSAR